MIYGTPIIAALLVFALAWRLFLSPLAEVKRSVSQVLREKALPDVVGTTTLFTTLSSSAVVLTVSVLQAWPGSDMKNRLLVVLSWGGFVGATLLGALSLIAFYVYRLHYLATTAEIARGESATDPEEKGKAFDRARNLIDATQRIEKYLFALLCLQLLSFTLAVFYLFAFASINLLRP